MFNSIKTTKITYVINGQTYIYSGVPDTPFTEADERAVELLRTTEGEGVSFPTNIGTAITVTGTAMNMPFSVFQLLERTFQENVNNNLDFRFTVILEGKNDRSEKIKRTYTNCVFSKKPYQADVSEAGGTQIALEFKALEVLTELIGG